MFEIGDSVISITFGNGVITSIDNSQDYPIKVQFENYVEAETFTKYDHYKKSNDYTNPDNIKKSRNYTRSNQLQKDKSNWLRIPTRILQRNLHIPS